MHFTKAVCTRDASSAVCYSLLL